MGGVGNTISGWLAFGALVALASGCGIAWARRLPWRHPLDRDQLSAALGLALAPLLFAAVAMLVLFALPGAGHRAHLSAAFVVLVLVLAMGQDRQHAPPASRRIRVAAHISAVRQGLVDADTITRITAALVVIAVGGLMADVLLFPLMQNDALEYVLTTREVYLARTLAAYPALDSSTNASGFYGPWTHPPAYVSSLYLAAIAQGHLDTPGLLRTIAPWSLIAGAALIFSLVRRHFSTRDALVATLTFVSPPLFILGAGSALLDALPVLALAVILAAVVALDPRHTAYGPVIGALVGASLWLHSQAVLLVPLTAVAMLASAAVHRQCAPRGVAQGLAMAGVAALVVGLPPYLRNYSRLGAFVSDSPPVFNAETLAWPDYFRLQRGLDSVPDILQYGLLKGFFAPEAYGPAYWLLGLGGIAILARIWRASRITKSDELVLVALAVAATYSVGTLASVFIGIDLMIRNERYLLLILPAVALVAAEAASALQNRSLRSSAVAPRFLLPRPMAQPIRVMVYVAVSIIAVQSVAVTAYRAARAPRSPAAELAQLYAPVAQLAVHLTPRHRVQLDAWDAFAPIAALRDTAPTDALVLSLKPADMLYSGRRMISALDPRLLPFYATSTPVAGLALLQQLGVTHVHLPDYATPPLYNSALAGLLADPSFTTLVSSTGGHQLYALVPTQPSRANAMPHVINAGTLTLERALVFGGRKSLAQLAISRSPHAFGRVSPGTSLPAFRRETTSRLLTEPLVLPAGQRREVRVRASLSGDGFVHIRLRTTHASGTRHQGSGQSGSGQSARTILIGETAFDRRSKSRTFVKRVLLDPDIDTASIVIEHRGSSAVTVHNASIEILAQRPHANTLTVPR